MTFKCVISERIMMAKTIDQKVCQHIKFQQRDTIALSTPGYLNRFRSGFRLFPMMWTVKNDFDADSSYPDQKAVRWVVSIHV